MLHPSPEPISYDAHLRFDSRRRSEDVVVKIDFLIDGLHETSSAQIEHEVRQVMREARSTDVWRFALLPSEERQGWWDLGVRGPNGWSITWFDATLEDLPHRAAATVRQLLRA